MLADFFSRVLNRSGYARIFENGKTLNLTPSVSENAKSLILVLRSFDNFAQLKNVYIYHNTSPTSNAPKIETLALELYPIYQSGSKQKIVGVEIKTSEINNGSVEDISRFFNALLTGTRRGGGPLVDEFFDKASREMMEKYVDDHHAEARHLPSR